MLAEIPRSCHSSSSSSEDRLLHCSDNEFNTSPEKSSPVKRPAPTQCPVSPVGLLTAQNPPLKFTFGATDVRLWDAVKISPVGDPMVTSRVSLKPLQPHQVEANTPSNLTITIKGMKPIPKCHCPICHEDVNSSLHHHAYQWHVPWYADPSHVCWECYQPFQQHAHLEAHLKTPTCSKGHIHDQVAVWVPHINQLFFKIAEGLGLPNQDALTSFVLTKHPKFLAEPHTTIKECNAQIYHLIEQTNCTYPRKDHTYHYNPPPCWAALLQWRTVASLIQLLPSTLQAKIMEVPHGPAEPRLSQAVPFCWTVSSSPVKMVKAAKTTHTSTSSTTVPSLLSICLPLPAHQPKSTSQPSQQGSGDLESPHPASSTPWCWRTSPCARAVEVYPCIQFVQCHHLTVTTWVLPVGYTCPLLLLAQQMAAVYWWPTPGS